MAIKKFLAKPNQTARFGDLKRGILLVKHNALRNLAVSMDRFSLHRSLTPFLLVHYFFVKVGAVSGADRIFASEHYGNMEFVCSTTAKDGQTKRMIYGEYGKTCQYLQDFKPELLGRKIKKFSEENWWEWGRDYHRSDLPNLCECQNAS